MPTARAAAECADPRSQGTWLVCRVLKRYVLDADFLLRDAGATGIPRKDSRGGCRLSCALAVAIDRVQSANAVNEIRTVSKPIEGRERLRSKTLAGTACRSPRPGGPSMRARRRSVLVFVNRPDLPDRLARRSHREHEEELEEHDCRKGDPYGLGWRRPLPAVPRRRPRGCRPSRSPTRRRSERVCPGEDALLRIPGRAIHDVRRVRVDGQGPGPGDRPSRG